MSRTQETALKSSLTDRQIARAKEMREIGMTYKEIAAALESKPWVVRYAVDERARAAASANYKRWSSRPENAERISEKDARWAMANPEAVRRKEAKYRASRRKSKGETK